ncbi:MAG: rhomboid family intramembrane serine protease [Bdellovibrionia bacterium]
MVELHRYIKSTLLTRKPKSENTIVGFLAIGVITLMSLIYWSGFLGLEPYLAATRTGVFEKHEYWRLFTAILIHADPEHLLSNSIGFGLFSYLLYDYFGFRVFPAATIFLGAAVHLAALATYPAETRLIGASGMVYLMNGTWLALYLLTERRLTVGSRLMRSVGFALAVLMPSTFEQNVSYRTHAIGFVVGVVYGLAYFFLHRKEIRKHERWATEVIEPLEPDREAEKPQDSQELFEEAGEYVEDGTELFEDDELDDEFYDDGPPKEPFKPRARRRRTRPIRPVKPRPRS